MPVFEYFKPYEGDKPYIFVSYAHADNEQVLPVIADMHRRGYNIWYDEGIEVGSEWQECIASHLMDAHLVVAFISNAYMRSDNCRREMHYAQTKRIKTINIFIEETELTPGMEMQIGNIFALMKYTFPSEEFFYEKLYGAPLLRSENFGVDISDCSPAENAEAAKNEKKHRHKERNKEEKPKKSKAKKIVGLSAGLVVFGCLLAALIVGYFTGFIEKVLTPVQELTPISADTVIEFSEPLLEQAAREYAGKSSGKLTAGDLKGLTALYIFGDSFSFAEPETLEADAPRGSIADLSDLYNFPDLQTLCIRGQSFNSLDTLPACGIETLDISDNRVASLDGIGRLPQLKKLTADNCPITTLGDLNRCLKLKTVSLIGATASDYHVFKPLTGIREIAFSNAALKDIAQVLDHSSLRSVSLYNCDLTGSFFRSFDRERAITTLNLVGCTLDSTNGIEDWTGLTKLRLSGTRGILDWTVLGQSTSLQTVYIDEQLESALSNIGSDAGFEIVIE